MIFEIIDLLLIKSNIFEPDINIQHLKKSKKI